MLRDFYEMYYQDFLNLDDFSKLFKFNKSTKIIVISKLNNNNLQQVLSSKNFDSDLSVYIASNILSDFHH